MTKKDLVEYLKNRNNLWSYDKSKINYLPDDLFIELILIYGDIEEIVSLELLYPIEKIRDIWEEKLLPNGYFEYAAVYVAFATFGIIKPFEYVRKFNTSHVADTRNNRTNSGSLL
jgi:hypothetical protein